MKTGTQKNGNKETYTWEHINATLHNMGYSPRQIVDICSSLKKTTNSDIKFIENNQI